MNWVRASSFPLPRLSPRQLLRPLRPFLGPDFRSAPDHDRAERRPRARRFRRMPPACSIVARRGRECML